jgi:WD40 repeat protein
LKSLDLSAATAEGNVGRFALHPDEKTLILHGDDGVDDDTTQVQVINLETLTFEAPLDIIGSESMSAIGFNADGSQVWVTTSDDTLMMWDWATRTPQPSIEDSCFGGFSPTVNPTTTLLSSMLVGQNTLSWSVCLFDLTANQRKAELEGYFYFLEAAALSPDAQTLIYIAEFGQVAAVEVATQQFLWTSQVWFASPIHFSPDGSRVVLVGTEQEVYIYDTQTGEPLVTIPALAESNVNLAFSPDGSQLAVIWGNRLETYQVTTGEFIAAYGEFGNSTDLFSDAPHIHFTSDGNYLIVASEYELARVALETSAVDRIDITGMAATMLGDETVFAAINFYVEVWRVTSWEAGSVEVLYSFPFPELEDEELFYSADWQMRFSPDGKYLVLYGNGVGPQVWNLATQQLVQVPAVLLPSVLQVAFSADNTHAIVVGDGIIHLWGRE